MIIYYLTSFYMEKIFAKFFGIINLIIYSSFIQYILKLKNGCDCSDDWRREYILYYSIFGILFSINSIFNSKSTIFFLQKYLAKYLVQIIASIIGISYIVYLYANITYVQKLKKNNCKCSASRVRNLLEILGYTGLGLIILPLILLPIFIAYYK